MIGDWNKISLLFQINLAEWLQRLLKMFSNTQQHRLLDEMDGNNQNILFVMNKLASQCLYSLCLF